MSYALEIKNLQKIYGNDFHALKGISFNVNEGDFMALLGPNGAGKSTTIGIISSLVNKSSGSVRVFGKELDESPYECKMDIGIVPQEFNFNQFEKVGNILVTQAGYFGIKPAIAEKRAEKYLKLLGLWEKRNEASRMLSGGMKRRLMIARALVHEPRLLILDEPTAGVDIELRRSMWDFLRKINEQGTTIILTTHYLEEAEQLCKSIAIIDEGVIIENTSMKQLLAKLDKETFVIDVEGDLSKVKQIQGFTCKVLDDHCFEVEVAKGQSLNGLFADLNEKGLEILSLRNKANRLEELFVSLVENKGGNS